MPLSEIINTLIIPLVGCFSVFGTIITVTIIRSRARLRMREYQLEEMRLANEAKQLQLEEQRLRLALDDNTRTMYNQLPR